MAATNAYHNYIRALRPTDFTAKHHLLAVPSPFSKEVGLAVRRALWALVLFVAVSSGNAFAHAYVVAAQPPADRGGAHVAGTVGLNFDEPIDLVDTNALEVLAPDGTRIDKHDARIDPQDATRVVVSVPNPLPRGIYTVAWRVISADSHVVHGTYRIGNEVALTGSAVAQTASPYDPSAPLASTLRWLGLVGALLATGALFLRIFCVDRLRDDFPHGDAIARYCALGGLGAIVVACVPAVVLQAAAATGTFGSGIRATLFATPWGWSIIVRIVAALVTFALAWRNERKARFSAAALLAVVLVTFSSTGHAMAQTGTFERSIAVLIDFTHLLAGGAWIGGVFVLTLTLLHAVRHDAFELAATRRLLGAFTPVASIAVGVVVATGLYATSLHIDTIASFVGSAYGQVLLVKIACVVTLLAFGLRHFGVGAGIHEFDRADATMIVESFVGLVVLALSAILAGQMPPVQAAALPSSLASIVLALLCVVIIVRFFAIARHARTNAGAGPRVAFALDAILVVLAATFLVSSVAGRFVRISSPSMYPDMQLGDVVWLDRITYRLRAPRDGDIVAYTPAPSQDIFGRVVASGGDTIAMRDGIVQRNGAALSEPYVPQPASYDLGVANDTLSVDGSPLDAAAPPKALWQAPDRVPDGFYLLLGDNRNYAIDSHTLGLARGSFDRPLLVVWPPSRIHVP
jgi:copper transport protein